MSESELVLYFLILFRYNDLAGDDSEDFILYGEPR